MHVFKNVHINSVLNLQRTSSLRTQTLWMKNIIFVLMISQINLFIYNQFVYLSFTCDRHAFGSLEINLSWRWSFLFRQLYFVALSYRNFAANKPEYVNKKVTLFDICLLHSHDPSNSCLYTDAKNKERIRIHQEISLSASLVIWALRANWALIDSWLYH